MSRLADADPFPRVFAHLQGLTALQDALGGPDRVGADHVPPYPRLRVRPAPGGSEDLRTGMVVQPARLEVLDSTDHPIGDEALRDILATAVDAVAQLPESAHPAGQPVISDVQSATKMQPLPEPDGRNRWFAILNIHAHPGAPA